MSEKTKDVLLSIFASLLCIVIGLLVGLIILYCINAENALDGFSRIIKGGFYLKPKGIGSEIAQATPLIMTGLSVAFAFKTGLFNIGAAGQYTLGVFGALYFALILQMPWYVCLLAAMVCGAIWGAVPGIFKAYFNVNEVITSIMFNWIGLYLVNELMYSTVSGMYDQKTTRTYKLSSAAPQSLIPDCGMSAVFKTSSTTIAIFIAMAIAIIMYVVLNKTTFGYELKACGFNKDAAKYAGINEKRNIVLSMTISGALAGIGAGLYYLSGASEWNPQVSTALPAIGFNGIPVALLALSNPIGVQDQYAVAYGGFRKYKFHRDGSVTNEMVVCRQDTLDQLKNNFMLYFTGLTRVSSNILAEQKAHIYDKEKVLDAMVEMVLSAEQALAEGDVAQIGKMLDDAWNLKKQMSSGISNPLINEMYTKAKNAGAVGGKILGAGGGGFMLLFVPPQEQERVRSAMREYKETQFGFETEGSRIIFTEKNRGE